MGRTSKYDQEFRARALELVRLSDRPRRQIAADLGISDTTLAGWMKKKPGNDDKALTGSERQELTQLRKEKREWLLEREILKKATAFWVKESNGS